MIYRKFIKPILFSLNIERAHRIALLLLRILGALPGGRWLLETCYAERNPALEREVFGIRFPNPVGLAAGFDRNGEALRELAAMGFGFIEIGTVTPRPQGGNPRPRVFRLPKDRAIVNRIGLANRGLKKTIQHLRRPHKGVIVGCNIGKNTLTPPEEAPNDYLKTFRNLYEYADYFTVNISCDNACHEGGTHTREYILRILEPLFDFRRGQNQYRPVMLKISPDMSDQVVDRITDILLETPLDGIVATNGTHSRRGLSTSRAAIDKIGSGRLSGSPLTQRAIEVVRRIHSRSGGNYPIIGVGGLMTPEEVEAMLDAGADLVQLYTGYIYNGPGFVREICRRLIARAEREHSARLQAETGQPAENRPEAAAQSADGAAAAPDRTETETAAGTGQPATPASASVSGGLSAAGTSESATDTPAAGQTRRPGGKSEK